MFIAQVACGGFHTLCSDANGRVYAFGLEEYGQLGLGDDDDEDGGGGEGIDLRTRSVSSAPSTPAPSVSHEQHQQALQFNSNASAASGATQNEKSNSRKTSPEKRRRGTSTADGASSSNALLSPARVPEGPEYRWVASPSIWLRAVNSHGGAGAANDMAATQKKHSKNGAAEKRNEEGDGEEASLRLEGERHWK